MRNHGKTEVPVAGYQPASGNHPKHAETPALRGIIAHHSPSGRHQKGWVGLRIRRKSSQIILAALAVACLAVSSVGLGAELKIKVYPVQFPLVHDAGSGGLRYVSTNGFRYVTLSVSGLAGRKAAVIESSGDCVHWRKIYSRPVQDASERFCFTLIEPADARARFYRLRAE
jgi:hypothetical protein